MEVTGKKNKVKKAKGPLEGIDSLLEEAWGLCTEDLQKAYAIAEEAGSSSARQSYDAGSAASRLIMARCESFRDHYYEALDLAEEARHAFIQLKDYRWQARSCRVMGYIYTMLGRYDKALGNFLSGKQLMEEHGIPVDFSFLNNIAAIYSNIGRYGEALEFYLQALDQAEVCNDPILPLLLSNIAEACLYLDDPVRALDYNRRALDGLKEGAKGSSLCHCHNTFGRIYAKMGRVDEAQEHLFLALSRAKEYGLKSFEIESSLEIGRLYNQRGEYDLSLRFLAGVLDDARKIEAGELVKNVLQLLAQTHEASGNYCEALQHYKEYMKLDKELASKDLERELNLYARQYKVEQAQKDVQLYRSKTMELTQKTHELEFLSRTDHLTGLYNRRYAQHLIDSENTRCVGWAGVYCIVLGDVDHFKSINDTYGHDCGDNVLRTLAAQMKASLRKDDCLSRWGGDEFLLLLPATSIESAVAISEKLRAGVQGMNFDYFGHRIQITMTFGIAQYFNDPHADSVVIRADRALYQGKNNGRNCVSAL